jgi:hypothetical protein
MRLSHANLMPSPEGWGSQRGMAPVLPSQGQGLEGWGSQRCESCAAQQVGVLVGCGSNTAQETVIQAGRGSGHSTRSWGPAVPEGWGSRGVGPIRVWIWHGVRAQHGLRGRDSGGGGGAWIWHGAVAWRSPRGGEPGRTEQQLCRPTGSGLGSLAVLLLDRDVEKSSTI